MTASSSSESLWPKKGHMEHKIGNYHQIKLKGTVHRCLTVHSKWISHWIDFKVGLWKHCIRGHVLFETMLICTKQLYFLD